MDYPQEFVRSHLRQFPGKTLQREIESKFWKQFKAPQLSKLTGAVTQIDFSSQFPNNFAVTAASRVLLYDGRTRKARARLAQFKQTAYSGCFRSDGRLAVAGCEDGIVRVFNTEGQSFMRLLKGHAAAVHVARFAADKLSVISAGDDATVRVWDASVCTQTLRLDGHSDYIRAAAGSPSDSNVWATGGYDHTCRLWDLRSTSAIMTLDHAAPIEDLAISSSGTVAFTAGGSEICVWDILGGGRLMQRLTVHQKTVTCLKLATTVDQQGRSSVRLLSGGLDGMVKVLDLTSFKVTHASKYPSAVMSIAMSPDSSCLAVGMADGTLSVRKRRIQKSALAAAAAGPQKMMGQDVVQLPGFQAHEDTFRREATVADRQARSKLQPHDELLRKFQYQHALDAALATNDPSVVVSLLEELAARAGLEAAIGGRDSTGLLPLLAALNKSIQDVRFTRIMAQVANRVLDVYADKLGLSQAVDRKIRELRVKVAEAVKFHEALLRLQGTLEPILHAAVM